MSRVVFRDFDELAASIDAIAGCFVPTARSSCEWWVEAAAAGRLSVRRVQIGGAATFAGAGEPGRLTLGVPLTSPRRIRIDGQSLDSNSLVVLKQGQPFTFAGRHVTRWAGVTLPIQHAALAHELPETLERKDGPHTHTDLARLVRLRWLIARVCCGSPQVDLSDPAAASAAEQELATTAAGALERSPQAHVKTAGRHGFARERVIARALELIETCQGQPLHVSDLCRATGVSERTLRNAFTAYFGVGPIRLLKVRQLREIRAALLDADPLQATVAGIAGRLGVWDFSLFARNYKRLFGESPSQTLRAAGGRPVRNRHVTWLRYAVGKFAEDCLSAAPSCDQTGLSPGTAQEPSLASRVIDSRA